MLILPVLIILRYTFRYYTILILAGASHVPVILIGEHFINFCIISLKNIEMRRSTFVVICFYPRAHIGLVLHAPHRLTFPTHRIDAVALGHGSGFIGYFMPNIIK